MSISASKQFLQIAKRNPSNFDEISVFVPDWDTTAFQRSFHYILHAKCNACRIQCRNNPCKSQNGLFQISTKTVISFRIEILQRLNALSTLFYTPNVAHVDFSVETIPANRKTQSFKFRRKICYFDPDWDITAFIRSLESILHTERTACRFQRRNKRGK
jgi:hypothetical protein